MPADPTLDLDLAAVLDESRRLAASVTPKSGPWDVIVVGSGAAGGMAAYQLATAGIKVLVLEAGRMIDHRKEYRTMEWPYASPRRHRLPPGQRRISVAEYEFLDRPYGNDPSFAKLQKLERRRRGAPLAGDPGRIGGPVENPGAGERGALHRRGRPIACGRRVIAAGGEQQDQQKD